MYDFLLTPEERALKEEAKEFLYERRSLAIS